MKKTNDLKKKYNFINILSKIKLYLISFALVFIALTACFIFKKITPFGNLSLLKFDSYTQYGAFMIELGRKLRNGENLFYSFANGLGTDFFGEATYYLTSPLNLILLFANAKNIATIFTILVMLKISFAAMNMSIYLDKHYENKKSITVVAFSVCYGFCSYAMNYADDIMWLDVFMTFPLIILSLEMLYKNKKRWLYTVILGISIIANFYIGYMICIFCVIYFLYLLFTDKDKKTFKGYMKKIGSFAFYSILAGAMAGVIIIPMYVTLQESMSLTTSGIHTLSNLIYYPWYINIYRMGYEAYPTYIHFPYIYCTIAAFTLIPLYVISKRAEKKEKIGKFAILIIMFIGFEIKIFDYAWNGFHITKCFAGRQSFAFIFIVLTMCFEAVNYYEKSNKKVTIMTFCLLAIDALSIRFLPYTIVYFSVAKTVFMTLVYYILINLDFVKRKRIIAIVSILIIAESCYSTLDISTGVYKTAYADNNTFTEENEILSTDSDFYRLIDAAKGTSNGGCVGDYNGVTSYSSMVLNDSVMALASFGYNIGDNCIENTYEPVSSSLLGIKYYVFKEKTDSAILEYAGKLGEDQYLYKNQYSLGIGFCTEKDIKNIKIDGDNPFDRSNRLIEKLTGVSSVYEKADLTKYIEEGTELYLYDTKDLSNMKFVSDDGEEETLYSVGLALNPLNDSYVYRVNLAYKGGYFTESDTTSAVNEITEASIENESGNSLDDESYKKLSAAVAYTLNVDNYKKAMEILAENKVKVNNCEDGKVSVTTTANENSTVFLNIPYGKGWSAKVDGKTVKIKKGCQYFMAIDVTSGEHKIELSYVTPGFYLGLIFTIVAILLLIVTELCIFYKKSHK